MKYKATLETESNDPESVAGALEIDNVEMDNLRIKSCAKDKLIITYVESNNIKTLINTLDDLISNQMLAEKVIR